MKKNTQSKAKLQSISKNTSLKEHSRSVANHDILPKAPALSLVPPLESSLSSPSSKNALPSDLKSRVPGNSLGNQSSLKKPKTKLTLAVSIVPDHSKELHVMANKDIKKPSGSTSNGTSSEAGDVTHYPPTVDVKFPDIMDFYKGWISLYEQQWQLFFKSWSQLLGNPSLSPIIFADQAKEFQQHCASLANQFQECTSIAERMTQDALHLMQGSSPQKSTDADKSTKDKAKS